MLYDNGLGYTSINSARSALSTLIGKIEGYDIGSHPLVCRLLKGIANSRPPKAKYQQTWDTNLVLTFCKSLGDNSQLSMIDISLKLIALLALTTGQRVQTLAAIRVSNIKRLNDGSCEIGIFDKLKTSKPGSSTVLQLPKYVDERLCVVRALDQYLFTTEKHRECDALFLSTRRPYTAAARDTISRWLKIVLKRSGIDISTYSGHSFRHASTSKANDRGVSVDSIFKAAGWCQNSKVFAKHYRRPIVDKHEFANAVLSI